MGRDRMTRKAPGRQASWCWWDVARLPLATAGANGERVASRYGAGEEFGAHAAGSVHAVFLPATKDDR